MVDVDTSATAVIYLNPRDDPSRSPSLAPGQVLPKVRRGGGRAPPVKKVGHVGIRKQVSRIPARAVLVCGRLNAPMFQREWLVVVD